MRYMKILILCVLVSLVGSCNQIHNENGQGKALSRTDTAIVGVYIDDKGYPQPTVEKVSVKPGQRIVFAGPKQFEIIFKDQRSPVDKLEIASVDGIVVLEIPRDIFERDRARAAASNSEVPKELTYRYGIRVDGKLTDPIIHISPDSQ